MKEKAKAELPNYLDLPPAIKYEDIQRETLMALKPETFEVSHTRCRLDRAAASMLASLRNPCPPPNGRVPHCPLNLSLDCLIDPSGA